MNTCSTCSHWKPPKNEYGEVPGVGTCAYTVQFWDASEWAEDGESRVLKPEHAARLAFVQDGSDYRAELRTMPSFGCVQHKSVDQLTKPGIIAPNPREGSA